MIKKNNMTQDTTPSPARAAAIIFAFISLVIGIAIWYGAHYPAPEFIEEHSEIPVDTSHSCPVGFEYYPTEMVGNCILVGGCSNDSMRRLVLEAATGCGIAYDSTHPGKIFEEGESGIRSIDSADWDAFVEAIKAGLKKSHSGYGNPLGSPDSITSDTLYWTDKNKTGRLLNPAQIDSLKAIPGWLPYGPRTTDSDYLQKVAAWLGLTLENLPLPDTALPFRIYERAKPTSGWQVYSDTTGSVRLYENLGDEVIAEWENDKLKILNKRKYAEWEEFCQKEKAERIKKMEDNL